MCCHYDRFHGRNALNVKLGHQRKLQRAIAGTKSQAVEYTLAHLKAPSTDGTYRGDVSTPDSKTVIRDDAGLPEHGGSTTKRKYERHPKPDEHAPKRPPSAYVVFSNCQ